ncbi:hypothetical protein DEO72_LG1g2608 [Vigna unguiculata]|uniref:Uncharacterized protein n=1 Tax=Vigna unguiculata TaxID=3917 RepID=A0A4D6KQM9_VIGUN|nr:hypothetical protein DEO72_LG1g2607 [Vigna unguiculata]QCD78971.1 hypothetical protein DEO72_LG1g2608 [Vigna unguiculata]
MAPNKGGLPVSGAGRRGEFRQAIVARTVAPGTASAWRYRLSRQAVVTKLRVRGAWRLAVSGSASEVRLLEFLELWLGTYPLSCGSGYGLSTWYSLSCGSE